MMTIKALAALTSLIAASTLTHAATYDIHLYDATICRDQGGVTCSNVDQQVCCYGEIIVNRSPDTFASAQAVLTSGFNSADIITRAYYGLPCDNDDYAGASTNSCWKSGVPDSTSSAYYLLDRGLKRSESGNMTKIAADRLFQIDHGLRYSIDIAEHLNGIQQRYGNKSALREYVLEHADRIAPVNA